MHDSIGFGLVCPAADLAARIDSDLRRTLAALTAAERELASNPTFAAHRAVDTQRRELDCLRQFANRLGLDLTPPEQGDPVDHARIA